MKSPAHSIISFSLLSALITVSCSETSEKATKEQIETAEEKGKKAENQYAPENGSSIQNSEVKPTDVPLPPPAPSEQKVIKFVEPKIIDEHPVDVDFSITDDVDHNVGMASNDGYELTSSHTSPNQEDEVYQIVEEMPEFPGGHEKLMSYLKENTKYPEEAKDLGIQGKVYVRFTVNKDGSISDVKVVRGVHQLLDQEAIRVVKSMPKWKPGRQNGQTVRVQMHLPIKFALGA
jgi:protein TonB